MARKTRKKTNKNSKLLTYVAWSLGIVALVLGSLVLGYSLGYESAKTDIEVAKADKQNDKLAVLKNDIKPSKKEDVKKTTLSKEEDVKKRLKEVLKTSVISKVKNYESPTHEYDAMDGKIPPAPIKKKKIITMGKPKLAIVLDDVCIRKQVKAIKALNLPITMSFLPPNSRHPNSAKLASKEKFYMVHLPMEAMNFTAEEPTTLHIKDSQKKIFKRIKIIKQLFPNVQYINNHTESKFTANEIAVNRLIVALNKYNINFVDSRTTSKTKVPKVMKNFGLKYISRDIFLDNKMNVTYVQKQLKRAIKVSKKYGSAIAIGHPHKSTIEALKKSTNLFKDVELVYINQL